VLALGLVGCFNPGPYGFDRVYRPLAAEQGHLDQAEQLTYQDVLREPNAYQNVEIAWFGVITAVGPAKGGVTSVSLQLRAHQARHLCRDDSRASCRVTVGQTDLGAFTALVTLRPEDTEGRKRVGPGGLLKIYGAPSAERDGDNVPVLVASYYRYWPIGSYVTTAARSSMLR
jgi:hypothetical protein